MIMTSNTEFEEVGAPKIKNNSYSMNEVNLFSILLLIRYLQNFVITNTDV